MGKSIGIDLGTTNSVAAMAGDDGDVTIFESRDGYNFTPSIVSLRPRRSAPTVSTGEILIGHEALQVGHVLPEETIYSFKRLMGLAMDDEQVREASRRLAYVLCAGDGGDRRVHMRLGGKKFAPEDLSALVLRRIREDVDGVLSEQGAEHATHAVITVPAYFQEQQREATRRAGELAGFRVKMILDEPVAAAIAHGVTREDVARRRIVVLDLGGGTFDITIIQQAGTKLQVCGTGGNMWLGGDNFDETIAEIVRRNLAAQGTLIPDVPFNRSRLRAAAESAKRCLVDDRQADVVLEAQDGRGVVFEAECTITREEVERAYEPYFRDIEGRIRSMLEQAQYPVDEIDYALLVGGSSPLPQFRAAAERVFSGRVRVAERPMECVARGAALMAQSLSGVQCPRCRSESPEDAEVCLQPACGAPLVTARPTFRQGGVVEEVTFEIPRSLGIGCRVGTDTDAYQIIIPGGTLYPMPAPAEASFRLGAGETIVLPIYEGDCPHASENHHQRTIRLQHPAELAPGSPVIVAFNYTRDRTLHITLTYPTLGTQAVIEGVPATETVPAKEAEDWNNILRQRVLIVQRFIEDYATYLGAPERRRLEELVEQANRASYRTDRRQVQRLAEALWDTALDSCGVASKLLAVEILLPSAPPPVAAELRGKAEDLRRAHDRGDGELVKQLTERIEAVLYREVRNISLLGKKAFWDGLLLKTPSAAGR